MSLITDFIDRYQGFPKLTIALLFGLIIVGGFGGGLIIHNQNSSIDNLNTILETKDSDLNFLKEINKEKLDLIDEKYTSKITQLDTRYNNLEYNIKVQRNAINQSTSSINNSTSKIDSLIFHGIPKSNLKDQLSSFTFNINKQIDGVNNSVKLIDSEINSSIENFNKPNIVITALATKNKLLINSKNITNVSLYIVFFLLIILILLPLINKKDKLR